MTQQEEEQLIRQLHGKKTLRQIQEVVGRMDMTYSGFRAKVQRMGLFRNPYEESLPWKTFHNLEYWKTPTLENSYWAGVLAGDGCIKMKQRAVALGYKISTKDESFLDRFISTIGFTGPKSYSEGIAPGSKLPSRCVAIQITSFQRNARFLRDYYNLIPNKTKRLGPTNLPDWQMNFAFLIGYIDADGSVEYKGHQKHGYPTISLGVTSSSRAILEWVKYLCDRTFPSGPLAGKRIANITPTEDSCMKYYFSGLRAAIAFDYLRQFPVPKMERKWNNPQVVAWVEEKKRLFPNFFLPPLSADPPKPIVPLHTPPPPL